MSANNENFAFSFPIWVPFAYLCIFSLLELSILCLTKVVKVDILVLFNLFDLKSKSFQLFTISRMLAVICDFQYVEVWLVYLNFAESFYHK